MPQPECRSVQSISSRARHGEAGVLGAEALGQRADHLVVGAAFARRLDQLRRRAGCAGCRRPGRRRRAPGTWWPAAPRRRLAAVSVMNCSCTQTNRSSRAKPRFTLRLLGRDRHRVGVLDEQRRDRRAAGERRRDRRQSIGADARLVEHAHRRVAHVEALDHASCSSDRCRRCCGTPPPPSCCQAPVTAGMQRAACMLAAPLRERAKP